jgi:hypothetical protein
LLSLSVAAHHRRDLGAEEVAVMVLAEIGLRDNDGGSIGLGAAAEIPFFSSFASCFLFCLFDFAMGL